MGSYLQGVTDAFSSQIPTFLAALAVLLGGWLVALLVSRLVGGALRRTHLDDRLAATLAGDPDREPPPMDKLGARIVFWVLMVLVVVAFLQVLGLGAVARPVDEGLDEVFALLPNLLSAALLALAGWILARILRAFVIQVAERAGIDDALGGPESEGAARPGLARILGDAIYGIVLLLFMVAVLETLGLEGVLTSLNGLLAGVLGFLPNLAAAAIIVLVGWIFARLVRRLVENLVAAAGLDRLGRRARVPDRVAGFRLSEMAGLVAYALVLLPVGIAALNALRLEAVTAPASDMLERFLVSVPHLFGAALLLALGYLIGRVLGQGTTGLLSAAGFDGLVRRLGVVPGAGGAGADAGGRVADAAEGEPPVGSGTSGVADEAPATAAPAWSPSAVVGTAVTVVVILFATVEALALLEFAVLADLVSRFLFFAGDVVAGLVVFGLGLLLAGWAADAVASSGVRNAATLARAARITIIVLVSFMALSQMGVADEIVVLAFGLLLGSAAVAMAIAFGVGGRDLARAQLERWVGPPGGRPR